MLLKNVSVSCAAHYNTEKLLVGYRCFEVVISILACCSGSNLTVTAVTPCLALPCCGQVGGPAAVLTDWSAFVRLSKGEALGLAEGLGGGVNTIPFVRAAVSCEERETDKASLSAWEGTAGDYGLLDTERQFCTHRTSCPHPRVTLNTCYAFISVYAKKKNECRDEWMFFFFFSSLSIDAVASLLFSFLHDL